METISEEIRSKRSREQYKNTKNFVKFLLHLTISPVSSSWENSKTVMVWLSNYILMGTSKTARKIFVFLCNHHYRTTKNTKYLEKYLLNLLIKWVSISFSHRKSTEYIKEKPSVKLVNLPDTGNCPKLLVKILF